MPCTHRIDPEHAVIFVTSTGVITDSDWVEGLAAMVADPHFSPDYRGLSDYSEVTSSQVSATLLECIATSPRSSASTRWAFFVKPGFAGSTIDFYQNLADSGSGHVRVFTSRAEAVEWLNEGQPPEKRIA